MRTSTYSIPFITRPLELFKLSRSTCSFVVCAAKGPRPRYPRVWKTQKKIGTISKSAKLVECIKGLSNTKEEVYGALDSFIAWDLEFPLIVVKKALKRLENEKEWKRIIQVTKWMLSKGQGKTLGSYLTLLNALVEDDRLDEAEEIWAKVLNENLERTPRTFFEKMVSIYYNRGMHEKLFEVFADLDELGVYPTVPIVTMVGNVFKELGMMDKYEKLNRKFPPPKWEFRYIKGKRIRIRVKRPEQFNGANQGALAEKSTKESSSELDQSDSANEGVSEVEESAKNSSNLHMEASTDKATDKNLSELYIEATEAEVRIKNSSELCEEKDDENNLNSAELYEEPETSSVELNGEACVSS